MESFLMERSAKSYYLQYFGGLMSRQKVQLQHAFARTKLEFARTKLELARTVMIEKEYVVRGLHIKFLVVLWKICDV